MQKTYFTLFAGVLLITAGCSIEAYKNIPYQKENASTQLSRQYLNIFTPSEGQPLSNVFVFIHGGGWDSGSPSLYSFLGRKLARKGVVTVIISYPLSPEAQYPQMGMASARAVKWVKENIDQYGGDPNGIFAAGHSSGGHLAALIALNNNYFNSLGIPNPIQGVILIDAAGLDMYSYLKRKSFDESHTYINTFTSDPENWKDASPIYYIDEKMPPLLIYRGGNTYESIERSTEKFIDSLKTYNPDPNYRVLDRLDHIAMIAQFIFSSNLLYDEFINFMRNN